MKRRKDMKKIFLMSILLLALLPLLASATTFYVNKNSASCNDNGAGTSLSAPWCTIEKANQALQAGDTVYIRAGIYTGSSHATINPANSGSPGNYITYQNYPSEEAVVTGTYHGVYFGAGKNYIRVDGITIDGVSQETSALALFVRIFSSHNIVQNCKMQYLKIDSDWGKGIYIEPGGDYNQILGNTIQYVGHAQPPYDYDEGEGIWVEGSYNLVERNYVDFCGHGDITYAGTGNVIRNNEFRGQWGRVVGLGGIDSQAHNLMELNKIWAAQGMDEGFMPNSGVQVNGRNHIFRKNLIYDSDGGGFSFDSHDQYTIEHLRIYNNVIYNSGRKQDSEWSYGVIFTEHDEGTMIDNIFKNNIFYKNYKDGVNYRDLSETTDSFFTNNRWNSDGDPRFANEANRDFHLQSTSPVIDAGAFLTTTRSAGSGTRIPVYDAGYFFDGFGIVEGDLIQLESQTATVRIVGIDYDNNILTLDRTLTWYTGQGVALAYSGNAPDIGAFEYDSGSPPPPCATADLNCDGRVDITDLIIVIRNFGKTTFEPTADTNTDGTIDIFDVVYVASRFT
jgi:hypothetical protein